MVHYLMVPAFFVVGIQIQTDNSRCVADVGVLWDKFCAEKMQERIPNRIDDEVLAVYSDYVGDDTKPFAYTIACRVSQIDQIPAGMVAIKVPAQHYALFTASGEFPGSLCTTWQTIWKSGLKRAYQVDFEVYGKEFATADKKVNVFIGITDQ